MLRSHPWLAVTGLFLFALPNLGAAPVDELVPWLLREDAQLRALPFPDVILAATGKKVLAVDPQDAIDQRVIKEIARVLDEVLQRVSAPENLFAKPHESTK